MQSNESGSGEAHHAKDRRVSAMIQDHLERKANWKKWGPYLSERSWGIVREDHLHVVYRAKSGR